MRHAVLCSADRQQVPRDSLEVSREQRVRDRHAMSLCRAWEKLTLLIGLTFGVMPWHVSSMMHAFFASKTGSNAG